MLKDKILEIIGERIDDVGIIVKDLNSDKWILRLNESKVFQSASIIKIPIMIEVLRQVEIGKLKLDKKIAINEKDKVDFSIISELSVAEYSILDLIRLMIIISDNTATNLLIDLVGYDSVRDLMSSLKFKDTKLKRKMMDFKAIEEGRTNTTSPIEMADMIEMIYKNEILNEEYSKLALDIMKGQLHKDCLTRYLPENTVIAHKTGELEGFNHDIGIVYSDKHTYMIGIFAENGEDNLTNKRLIGNISKLVYDYF